MNTPARLRRGRPWGVASLALTTAWIISGLLAATSLPATAAEATRNVLVLYSNGRLLPANIEADQGLRQAIRTSAQRTVGLFDEFLDVTRFGGAAYAETVATYLREKYAARPPDVIIVAGDDALNFLLRYRPKLFPQAPVVHMGIPISVLRSHPPLPADVVGVPVEYDFSRTIDQALRWHPQARRLVIVTGASPADHAWEARVRVDVVQFQDRVTAEFLAGFPTDALQQRLGQLGSDAVVLTTGYFQDGAGRNSTPREAAQAIAAAATAPVYGPFNTFIGAGIVGGYMPSFAAMGRQAGDIVNRLFDGMAPTALTLPAVMPTSLNVDWRQARRWGIAEKAMPDDVVVHFREPSLFEEHRNGVIIAAVVFLLQAAMTAWLLLERFRRRQAEQAVQKQRFELVHASRLAVGGELTASIAHEINQPLGAILNNAEAALLILESGTARWAEVRDELRTILADIRRDDLRASEVIRCLRGLLSKQTMERQPFELGETVREVRSVLHAEAQRRGVTLDLRSATTAPITLVGDRIEIQQVLLNLVLNAMDAVTDAPEDQRTIVISVEQRESGIRMTVRDHGHGIAAEHLPKLFDSFFSTKRTGMGLGLSIARTLVAAHGGRIWAESIPGDGAAFHLELPTAGATDYPAMEQA